ncbi:hypothetical protein DUI87_26415 [Hirundo rustica rustica]|uniref:Reverse transcriptase domain-containing protein n=1 Tax=Hirundo rustica rustica TaxID=333673 RepID=A0A3M0J713_HIRRU|nr:hypothetical protein DUI87_26415 [Hirundo rustica rustica]
MYSWRSTASGAVRGLYWGPVLFNIFINDIDEEDKFTLSRFADATHKLSGRGDAPEGQDGIQRDLHKFEKWIPGKPMKLNEAKCKVLHLSHVSLQFLCRLGMNRSRAALLRT